MPSKQVTDRKKSAGAILALIDPENVAALSDALSTFFKRWLRAGETMPNFQLMLTLLWRALHEAITELSTADQANIEELANDAAFLDERDNTAAALSALLVKLREKLAGVFGADNLSALGFRGETPADPTVLASFAKEVVDAINKGPLPTPQDEELSYNPTKSVDAIEKTRLALELSLGKVAVDKRANQTAQNNKNQKMSEYNNIFTRVSNYLEGAYQLVGLKDLAKKVRPSTRRLGQLLSEDEATATVEDGNSAD